MRCAFNQFEVGRPPFGKDRGLLASLSVSDEMHEHMFMLDVISFNAAISACENDRKWEQASSLLDEMRERGVTPDVISFSAAIPACEKGKKREQVLSLLDDMRERETVSHRLSSASMWPSPLVEWARRSKCCRSL